MTFTTIGFYESQDSATLAAHNGISDPHVTVTGDDIFVPAGMNKIVGAMALGADITRAQFRAPSLLNRMNLELDPIDINAEPATKEAFHNYGNAPLNLVDGEAINFFAAEDAAGAGAQVGLLWLSDAPIQPFVSEDVFSIRATSSTTCVAYTWTNGQLTLDQDLEAGEYALVGASCVGATCIAARFVFGNQSARPAVLGKDLNGDGHDEMFRHGKMGILGTFKHNTLPTVDFLAVTTDSAQTLTLDLVKIA